MIMLQLQVGQCLRQWNRAVDLALDDKPVEPQAVSVGAGFKDEIRSSISSMGFWIGHDVPHRDAIISQFMRLSSDLISLGCRIKLPEWIGQR